MAMRKGSGSLLLGNYQVWLNQDIYYTKGGLVRLKWVAATIYFQAFLDANIFEELLKNICIWNKLKVLHYTNLII